MGIPSKVQADADAADAMLKGKTDGKQPGSAAAPAGQQQQPPASQAPATPPEGAESWEQKYKALDGKFRAEVPRLVDENRYLRSQNTALQQQLETQRAAPAPQSQPASTQSSAVSDDELKKAIEVINNELPEISGPFQTILNAAMGNKTQAAPNDQSERLDRVEKTVMGNASERFSTELKGLVPDINVLNVHPDFLLWMEGNDEYSGISRWTLFDDAVAKFDAKRAAKFFNAWKTQSDYAPPAPPPDLNTQLQPEHRGGNAGVPIQPKYTVRDYERHQDEYTKGKWRGRDNEWAALDREIWAALNSGGNQLKR